MRTWVAARAAVAVVLAGALAVGCGDDDAPASQGGPPGFYILVSNSRFSPLELAVPPGRTVTVVNADAMLHSVTSQATAGAFVPGGVSGIAFDTGEFTGTRTFTVPSGAAEGTIVPYYCRTHTSTMGTPNATIVIRASAQPGPAPR